MLCRKTENIIRFKLHILFFSFLFFSLFASSVAAREITLAWDPNNEPDLSHYIVYWGISSGNYSSNSGNIGLVNEYTADIPDDGNTYFFAVTAVDLSGLESDFSNEVNTIGLTISPSANAGSDQQAQEGRQVILDGSGSTDPDGEIVSWHWVQTGGTPVELDDHTAVKPSFTTPYVNPEGESLTFELTVTDSDGLQGTDFCIVNVIWTNEPPYAIAGQDQNVNAGDPVVLDGSGSFDSDGYIVSYNWIQTSGTSVSLNDPTAVQPEFEAPNAGPQGEILVFKLVVTDNQGLQSSSECLIDINPEAQVLSIKSSWNLITISQGSENTSIEDTLAPIMANIISIWSYNNGAWRVYDPANPGFSDLLEVEPGRGIWINMRENAELPIQGIVPVNGIDLSEGWNLVGFSSADSREMSDAISSIVDHVKSVWAYKDGQWRVYDPASPGFSDLVSMEPGYGYWVKASSSCSWTY